MTTAPAQRADPSSRASLNVGLYSLAELSRYISLPLETRLPTLVRWIRQGLTPSGHQGGRPTYSFHDLVSLLVVGRLRTAGVKLATIREAEAYLRGQIDLPRPFATEQISTDGVNVLFRANPAIRDQLTAANLQGQEVLEKTLGETLRGVHYEDKLAAWWEVRESIRLDPQVQFGSPCIEGTRVSTAQLRRFKDAGDSEERIAALYELPLAAVQQALAFEGELARAV